MAGRIPGDRAGIDARGRPLAPFLAAAWLVSMFCVSAGIAVATCPSQDPTPIPTSISKEMASANGWNLPRHSLHYSGLWFAERYRIELKGFEIQRIEWAGGRAVVQFLQPASSRDGSRLWSGLERDRTPNEWLARGGGVILIVVADTEAIGSRIQRALFPDAETSSTDGYGWVSAEIPVGISGLRASKCRFEPDVAAQEHRVRGISLAGVYKGNFDFTRARSIGERPAQVSLWLPRNPSDLAELGRRLNELPQANRRVLVGKRCVALVFSAAPEASDLLAGAMEKKGYLPVAGRPAPPAPSSPTIPPSLTARVSETMRPFR